MVADKFTELQKAVGPEITKTDLVPAFQVNISSISTHWRHNNVSIQFPRGRYWILTNLILTQSLQETLTER